MDEAIAALATRQLAALGVSQAAISRRCAAGRLQRLHQGVYAVGHPLLSRDGSLARRRARIENLLGLSSLDALVRARPKRRGSAGLTAAIDQPPTLTRSELEDRFLAICRTHDLPTPHTSAIVEGLEVDLLFPRSRLVVETDGWGLPPHRRALERDRERDATLRRAG